MKATKLTALSFVIMLLLAACSGTSKIDNGTLPASDGANEIAVALFERDDLFYRVAADRFEDMTGVKVNIKNYLDKEILYRSFETGDYAEQYKIEEIYVEKMKTELMAGIGADIYHIQGIDEYVFGNNGHLCDVSSWIEEDKDFSDNIVFKKLLTGTSDGGKQYSVPLGFSVERLYPLSEVPEFGSERLTWREFFEKTKDLPKKSKVFDDTGINIFMNRYNAVFNKYVDLQNRTQSLNNPEIIALLKECKKWQDDGLCADASEPHEEAAYIQESAGDPITVEYPALYCCSYAWPSNATILSSQPVEIYGNIERSYPMVSDYEEGERNSDFWPSALMGINAGSKNRRTAWEFVKFLLSPSSQVSNIDDFSLNRQIFAQSVEKSFKKAEALGADVDVAAGVAEAVEFVGDSNGFYISKPYYSIGYDIIEDYFYERITAEEAAKRIANKTGIFLKEMN